MEAANASAALPDEKTLVLSLKTIRREEAPSVVQGEGWGSWVSSTFTRGAGVPSFPSLLRQRTSLQDMTIIFIAAMADLVSISSYLVTSNAETRTGMTL